VIHQDIVVVRGGGDIATGTICRLHNCGFKIVILETEYPTAIRRAVAFSEAVYDGTKIVENIMAKRVDTVADCDTCWHDGVIPLFVDPGGDYLPKLAPLALVDAILAKKNYGTRREMAPVTIGLGPGFSAGKDVHAVIETARGHQLGRIIYSGDPLPNSGIPGEIAGHSKERVFYAPAAGVIKVIQDIGTPVNKGDVVAQIGSSDVLAPISGWIRGMIRPQSRVEKYLKIGDIDPRLNEAENCFTISDKARCISGGVVEAILSLANKRRAETTSKTK
jgi:xanthine dehydrogenase accessory factor